MSVVNYNIVVQNYRAQLIQLDGLYQNSVVQNVTDTSPGKVSTLEICYPREGTIEMKRNWDKER